MPDLWTTTALVYLVMSALTFLLYGLDKFQASRRGGRVPERTLHLFELLGGWPGALLGMAVFRHKTQKRSFRLVFFAVVALHLAGWAAAGWFLLGGAR